jgi:hypothetical protein
LHESTNGGGYIYLMSLPLSELMTGGLVEGLEGSIHLTAKETNFRQVAFIHDLITLPSARPSWQPVAAAITSRPENLCPDNAWYLPDESSGMPSL